MFTEAWTTAVEMLILIVAAVDNSRGGPHPVWKVQIWPLVIRIWRRQEMVHSTAFNSINAFV